MTKDRERLHAAAKERIDVPTEKAVSTTTVSVSTTVTESPRAGGRSAVRAVATGVAAAAGSVVAAATLAAGIVMSPAPDPAARMGGVHDDLQRAVQLNQITGEQAAFFEAQLARAILEDDGDDAPGSAEGFTPDAVEV